ncbi:MAG: hypothetical protein AAFS12_00230 [Cyanobacteria bacterium J06632_19]
MTINLNRYTKLNAFFITNTLKINLFGASEAPLLTALNMNIVLVKDASDPNKWFVNANLLPANMPNCDLPCVTFENQQFVPIPVIEKYRKTYLSELRTFIQREIEVFKRHLEN